MVKVAKILRHQTTKPAKRNHLFERPPTQNRQRANANANIRLKSAATAAALHIIGTFSPRSRLD